ncbi:MAG: ATP-dependent DNA ligase [Acidimicrobiales bacterium]
MDLPVMPPVRPMLAKAVHAMPDTEGLLFEPKWDGFRCIVFRDGDEVELGSRNDRPLTRYFPELPPVLRDALPEKCVVDGEVVVPIGAKLDFEALQQRIHPADSRVNMLAEKTPASFVAFDLLAVGDEDLRELPFRERRKRLEKILGKVKPPLHLTPNTEDRAVAEDWFDRFEGAGFDGVMAKDPEDPYLENKRSQLKIKHKRTADCVVAGYRTHKDGEGIGSLLMGVYDDEGELHHLGVAASFSAAKRKELIAELAPYEKDALADHPWREWSDVMAHEEGGRKPGAQNRWTGSKDQSWSPLRLELVAEVTYDGLQSGRFRHTSHWVRWRRDKTPAECTFDQFSITPPAELQQVFADD